MPPIRRVRQHVNPLNSKYANPVDAPDWAGVFADPQLPLHVDIGCGKGDFVREMAGQVPDWNFLGLVECKSGHCLSSNYIYDSY